MKIGELVKAHIKKIFRYCDTVDHGELIRLMDKTYSKNTFDINFPFCTEMSQIPREQSKRYWTDTYVVRGKTVRVSSQWFDGQSRSLFVQYLLTKKIVADDELEYLPDLVDAGGRSKQQGKQTRGRRLNRRYRGNAIGNAQNALVRNILSNLGQESFRKKDWEETKAFFSQRCAYCGREGKLEMEHVIPINRQFMGEHRLGNLVPSCQSCNARKQDKDFHEFLGDDTARIEKIEAYMESRDYVPLGDSDQVRSVLEMAYEEVSLVAERYISILNELFPNE
jgi:5-methylcytosine-specific restriction endonuclease McrA